MAAWVRERIRGEDGLSLVEVVVAAFIITVALMALLSAFVTSAQSAIDQQLRSGATRAATEHLEGLRAQAFDDLEVGTATSQTVSEGGHEYELTTTIEWMDAEDGGAGEEDLKLVTVTVAWEVRGEPRSSEFTTAISPLDVEPEDAGSPSPTFVSAGASPDPVSTQGTGGDRPVPDEDIQLDAAVAHFDPDPVVTATWENAETGESEEETLGSIGDDKYHRTVDAERFPRPDDGVVTVTFATSHPELTRSYDLLLLDPDDDGPEITSASVSPAPITLHPEHQHGCDQTQRSCKNKDPVAFEAKISGFDSDDVNAVKVRFLLRDGTNHELALHEHDSANNIWRGTIPEEEMRFKPGSGQPFTFVATRGSDGVTGSTVVEVTVMEEG